MKTTTPMLTISWNIASQYSFTLTSGVIHVRSQEAIFFQMLWPPQRKRFLPNHSSIQIAGTNERAARKLLSFHPKNRTELAIHLQAVRDRHNTVGV